MRSARKGKRKTRKISGRGAYYPGGRVLKGRGGFFDDLGNIARGIAGPVVGAVSSALNKAIPGAGSITQGIANLVGMGAYTPVRSNAILAQPVPKVGSAQDKGITYQHQEFLGDVTSSADWELTQFRVNPGLPESFPWLSTLASSFQKYRITGLVFYLRSTSSVAIASTDNLALGTVLGAYQYNLYDAPPASKIDMLALSGSLSGKPSEDHIYPMECAPSKNAFDVHLVRHTGVIDDVAKYDHAIFNLATYGFPGEYALGELWVSYNITLMAPKIEDALPYLTVGQSGAPAVDFSELTLDGTAYAQIITKSGSLDTSQYVQNTLGWDVVNASDGLPCIRVPAGTSGYFQMSILAGHSGSALFANTGVLPKVIDDSGTATTVAELPASFRMSAGDKTFTQFGFWHLAALPDRPLLLRAAIAIASGTTLAAYEGYFCFTRCSDAIVKPPSTGRGTVSTYHKVKRSMPVSAKAQSAEKMLMPQPVLARQSAANASMSGSLSPFERTLDARYDAWFRDRLTAEKTKPPLDEVSKSDVRK